MLNKNVAGFLAITLGSFGVHRFYLGQRFQGFFRFLAFVFLVVVLSVGNGPSMTLFGILMGTLIVSAFVEGLLFFLMPRDRFNRKYNKHHSQVTAPANVTELKQEGVRYFKSGDIDLATEAFQEALEVDATDAGVHFNLACCFSKRQDLNAALYHLELAVGLGLPEARRIDRHPALAWLRGQPSFANFRAQNYRRQWLSDQPLPLANQPEAASSLELHDLNQGSADPVSELQPEEDLVTKIRKLGQLRESGILTEAEFVAQKEKLLG